MSKKNEPRRLNAAELAALRMSSERLTAAQAYMVALEGEQNPVLLAHTETVRANLARRIGELTAEDQAIKAACGVPAQGRYVVDAEGVVRTEVPMVGRAKLTGVEMAAMQRAAAAAAERRPVEHAPVDHGFSQPLPVSGETPEAEA